MTSAQAHSHRHGRNDRLAPINLDAQDHQAITPHDDALAMRTAAAMTVSQNEIL
jgi:hypothetical protein